MANTVGPQWNLWCLSSRWPFWTHGFIYGNHGFVLRFGVSGWWGYSTNLHLLSASSSSVPKLTWSPVLCNFLLEREGAEEAGLILVISLEPHSPKVRHILISLLRIGRETLSSRNCPPIWSPSPTSKLIYTFYMCKGRFQIFHCALYSKKVLTNLKLAPSLKCVYLTQSMKHHINNTSKVSHLHLFM